MKKIYIDSAPGICNFIRANGGTLDEGKDVLQDAIETILFKLKKNQINLTSDFSNYLFGVCKFIWWNRRRKKSRSISVTEDQVKTFNSKQTDPHTFMKETNSIVAEETAIEIAKWNLLKEKLRLLPENCQQIYELTFARKKAKDMEEVLGKRVSHIRKIKSQCKQKLMDLVRADFRYQNLYA